MDDVRVSVVVPVCDPGDYISACLMSVLDQSLPAHQYEAIFVDDGSTDGTAARLDEVAERHAQVRVIHLARTGSPCAPRNAGIDAARGEYVYFLDDDDWLENTALEHLHRYAREHGADVAIGRTVGHGGRKVPNVLFRHNRPQISLHTKPQLLLMLLTPHKMFRKAFLEEHGIRFLEKQRRLEDHHFCLQAYFRTDRVAVLADQPCYHWRRRGERADFHAIAIDPAVYYQALRSVLDLVEANTEPGPYRNKLLSHWYSSKMLKQLGGMREDPETRQAVFDEVHVLAVERFPPAVDNHLSPAKRVRSALLRERDYDGLTELAGIEAGIHLAVHHADIRWEYGQLLIHLTGALSYADAAPVTFRRDGARRHWELPVLSRGAVTVPPQARDATRPLAKSKLDLLLKDRKTGLNIFVPTSFTLVERDIDNEDGFTPEVVATGRIDPATETGGGIDIDDYDPVARFRCCGWVSYEPVRSSSDR